VAEEKPTCTLALIVVEKPTVQVSASTAVQESFASALAESAEHLQPVQAVKDSMDQVDASSLAVTSEESTSQLSPQEARQSIPKFHDTIDFDSHGSQRNRSTYKSVNG